MTELMYSKVIIMIVVAIILVVCIITAWCITDVPTTDSECCNHNCNEGRDCPLLKSK